MSRSATLRRETIICEGERDGLEDSWGVEEIQPVALQIQVALDFRPSELHAFSVYTCLLYTSMVARRAGDDLQNRRDRNAGRFSTR